MDVSLARANLWDVSARMLAFVLPRGSRQGVFHAPVRVQIVGMSQRIASFGPVNFSWFSEILRTSQLKSSFLEVDDSLLRRNSWDVLAKTLVSGGGCFSRTSKFVGRLS